MPYHQWAQPLRRPSTLQAPAPQAPAVLVAAGETVAEGQPMLEVETDKAAVEIPSPASGRVTPWAAISSR